MTRLDHRWNTPAWGDDAACLDCGLTDETTECPARLRKALDAVEQENARPLSAFAPLVASGPDPAAYQLGQILGREAHAAGRAARDAGQGFAACPHAPGDPLRRLWLAGFVGLGLSSPGGAA